MRTVRLLLPFLGLLLFYSSCVPEVDDVVIDNWEPEVAIPLINTEIQIADLLNNFETGGFLEVDDQQFITLVYEGNIYSQIGEETLEIPNLVFPMTDTFINIPIASGMEAFKLQEIILKAGTFSYEFDYPLTQNATVIIQIPNLIKDGESYEKTISVDNNGVVPYPMDGIADISGYTLMTGENFISIRYIIIDPSTGERTYLQNMTVDFRDLKYSYVEGDVGQYLFNLPMDSIKIDLFTYANGGNLILEDPRIKLTFQNSFGVPIETIANQLEAVNGQGQVIPIESTLNNGFMFNFPSLTEVGEFKETILELNASNSNIAAVIASNPQQINYHFTALTNPNNEAHDFFLLDTSYFDVDVDVELPMWLRATQFIAEERIDFDASVLDEMIEAEFKIITENRLPIDVGLQIYFEDDHKNVLDSLLTSFDTILESGMIDENGKVISTGDKTLIVPVTSARLNNYAQATKIRLKGTLSTHDMGNTAVRFFSDYGIRCKVGVKAKLKEF